MIQNNTNLEFARLFSIKESLVKADTNINKIELTFNNDTPTYENYKISSSTDENNCISTVIIT